MANKHGDYIWYELLTSDAAAAQGFYGKVLEWTFADSGMAGLSYTLIKAPEHDVGGLLAITPEMAEHGARPTWLGYVAVDDVDTSVASIVEQDGRVLMPAMDIAQVGRIALVADPQGAPFYVMTPNGEGESLAFAYDMPRIGHCAWNELVTSDQPGAWAFYGKEFGWEKEGDMDMGAMGKYEFIRHGSVIGAMMTGTPEMGPPHWNQYFRVADIDKARAAVEANGGTVVNGPMEIPGGDYAMNAVDPQGVHFNLVGARH